MPTVGRLPIQSLRPLTARQIAYLDHIGALQSNAVFIHDRVWWYRYFAQANGAKPDVVNWDDPGFDVSNKHAYTQAVQQIQTLMLGAKTNRGVQQKMVQDGLYPPELGRDPYAIPAYFGWWQAENAFRRGFMSAYEDRFLHTFKESLKNVYHGDGNILTESGMEGLADEYHGDPFIRLYLSEMASDIAQPGKGLPFSSLKAIYLDLLAKREQAYQQFSPYFQALRWAPGGGLVGINPERG